MRIEPSSGVPIARQLADQIRTQCASGNLKPGDRLPSVRELARTLAINQNTVLRVYERLTNEQFLDRRHGDGTYVADKLPANQIRSERVALRGEFRRLVRRARTLGISSDELHLLLDRALAESNDPANPTTESKR